MNVSIDPHPLLDAGVFLCTLPGPLFALPSPTWLQALLLPDTLLPDTLLPDTLLPDTLLPDTLLPHTLLRDTPLSETLLPDTLFPDVRVPSPSDDGVRAAVRDLLRVGGFKPTGRSKPASEYLKGAAAGEGIRSINAVVDACNVASLRSGLPISVVDLDQAEAPFRIAPAPAGSSYVFNSGGQVIDISGLLCLWDAAGPCANPVKDAQRTKTQETTTRTLSVVWGTRALGTRAAETTAWYRSLLERLGAKTEII